MRACLLTISVHKIYSEVSVYSLGRRSVQQIKANSGSVSLQREGQIIQPPTTTVGQVESGRGMSALYILSGKYCPLKFQRVYASF
jgi:hypothetical protein